MSPIALGTPQPINVEDGDDFVDLCLGEGLPEAVFAVDVPSVGQLEVIYDGDALMPTFGIYDDCRVEPFLCGNGLDDRLSRTLILPILCRLSRSFVRYGYGQSY